MNARQSRAVASLRRAQQFLDDHPGLCGAVNRCAARAQFDDALASIDTMASDQAKSRQEGREASRMGRQLAQEIRNHQLWPIVTIARACLDYPWSQRFSLPAAGASVAEIQRYAEATAYLAQEHVFVFVENGLAPDFLVCLRSAAAELKRLLAAIANARRELKGATVGIPEALRRARTLSSIIDSLLAPKLASNRKAREEWALCRGPEQVGGAGGAGGAGGEGA